MLLPASRMPWMDDMQRTVNTVCLALHRGRMQYYIRERDRSE
jgi:hypothetical protein